MAILVSDLELVLVSRTRGLLVAAGMSVLTDGTNPDLIDPITWGMGRIGVYPATGLTIGDGDLEGQTAESITRGVEYAEYRLLVNVAYSDTFADTKVGNGSIMLSQILRGLEMRIGWLTKRLGLATQPLVGGFITKQLTPRVADELSAFSSDTPGSP